MQAVYSVQVTANERIEKRFPQGRGVGVSGIVGEETGKRDKKKGPGTRIARVGD